MLPKYLYDLLLVAVCALAFWRGRGDERLAALTCLGGTLLTVAAVRSAEHSYTSVETNVLVVDGAAFLIFTAIALRSPRFWPLWVAGFQLTSVCAHVIRAFDDGLIPKVYAVAERFWIYPIFLAIAVGTWRTGRMVEGPDGQRWSR